MKVLLLPLAGCAMILSATSCSQNKGSGNDSEIAQAVAEGTMPPWMAEYSDSSYETGNYTSTSGSSANSKDYSYNPPPKPSSSKASKSSSSRTKSSSSRKSSPTARRTPSTTTYTVKKNDTLGAIARRYGTSVKAIKSANGLRSDIIQINQKLKVPRGK